MGPMMWPYAAQKSTIGEHEQEWEPLVGDPILAWRVWRLIDEDGLTMLMSTNQRVTWPRRERLTAVCKPTPTDPPKPDPGHVVPAPALSHTCGIYAVKSEKSCRHWHVSGTVDTVGTAVGTVHLWGRIVQCERGYRAQFAYPASLVVVAVSADALAPAELADMLSDGYGVPSSVDLDWITRIASEREL